MDLSAMRSISSRLRTSRQRLSKDRSASSEYQVSDDPKLLTEMMADIGRADPLYQPTNYWAYYEKSFLPELKRLGLTDFRRRRNSVLSSFGATDEPPAGRVLFPWSDRATIAVNALLSKLSPLVELGADCRPSQVIRYFHRYVAQKFERIGWDLRQCPANRMGNPEVEEIDGQLWSLAHLQYCSMLADAATTITFSDSMIVCELGIGLGRNIEVTARLFPKATLLIFDIPPQLYVSNQYLSAVFGSRVIGYRDAVALEPASGRLPAGTEGKIIVLPTWKMPAWSKTPVDVFWNSASFQEMEPDVVLNYLGLVKSMAAKWVYINARPKGNPSNYADGEWRPGRGG